MAKIAEPRTLTVIRAILDQEVRTETPYRLTTDMIQAGIGFERRFDEVLMQLEKLRQGFSEISGTEKRSDPLPGFPNR
jgi:hypothetical protein